MTIRPSLTHLLRAALAIGGAACLPSIAKAQADSHMTGMADHVMSGPMDSMMMRHMEMTPLRKASLGDTLRAQSVAKELKRAIAKYQDTAVAVADGYKMFLPGLKNQRVFHFTNGGRALMEAFRFNAEKPTSLLYKRGPDGKLKLVGAMYTMPKRASLEKLDDRVPLSIARWHKHVNWCVPKKGSESRWLEQKDGHALFGPESPVATKAECTKIGGDFHENLFGWMIHANVYEGTDLGAIFGDDHR